MVLNRQHKNPCRNNGKESMHKGWLQELREEFPEYNRKSKNHNKNRGK